MLEGKGGHPLKLKAVTVMICSGENRFLAISASLDPAKS
jgi:hypothetical protein